MTSLIQVENLRKYFLIKGRGFRGGSHVKAIDGISFEIEKGEVLGLVGESGCGKTTVGRVLVGLYSPDGGKILFRGESIVGAPGWKQLQRKLQIIFQDPFGSLDGYQKIGNIIAEPLRIHRLACGGELDKKLQDLMNLVGLDPRTKRSYPGELSAGRQQLVAIARALATEPEFIVADEIVSNLDVSAQAQILNLMVHLQKKLGLTCLFISHALNVIKHVADRIVIMYLGKVVEIASTEELESNPCHPYTKALFSAALDPDPRRKRSERILLEGEVPSPINPPPGCRFHPRCFVAMKECSEQEPILTESSQKHWVSCLRFSSENNRGPKGGKCEPLTCLI